MTYLNIAFLELSLISSIWYIWILFHTLLQFPLPNLSELIWETSSDFSSNFLLTHVWEAI